MCKLLVNNGCNPLQVDKSKKTAAHFAKVSGHKHVVEYLNGFKKEAARNKAEKSMESSQNIEKRGRKKEIIKADYCLVYTNENGEIRELTL